MRKLRVLPEVLPAPIPLSEESPRARTVAHMRRLLGVAAATAAMSCSKEDPMIVKTPDDVVKKKPDPPPDPPKPAPSPSPSIDPGYMVVDMLPPPAACDGASSSIKASAQWDASASEIELKLGASTKPDVHVTYPAKAGSGGTPSISGGTIVSTSVAGGGASLRLKKSAGATAIFVTFPLACKAGSEHLNVYLDVTKSAVAGASIPVTLSDAW